MKRMSRIGWAAAVGVISAFAPAMADGVTVGRFYREIARAKHLGASDAASAETSLRAAGVRLPELALEKTLTEADMMAISNVIGITVTTTHPSQAISETQLSTYIASFNHLLDPRKAPSNNRYETYAGGNDQGDDNNDQGGKKKGRHHSNSAPF